MELTIIAIDGTGIHTAAYLALLEDTLEQLPGSCARFLTADPAARSSQIACRSIPRLDYKQYSRFCVERLGDHVETAHCLTVQLDGFIVNPERWQARFLEYDFVGAPWLDKPWRRMRAGRNVGNGGFSLRSRRFLEFSKSIRWYGDWPDEPIPKAFEGNEDYFLTVMHRDEFERAGLSIAPEEVAREFSLQAGDQTTPDHTLERVFGFHGTKLLEEVHAHMQRRGRACRYERRAERGG